MEVFLVLVELTKEELKSFFDETSLKVIRFFLKKSILSQPEKLKTQSDLPIQIPKEHIEQWVVQSLGVTPVGAGSYPIDVKSNDWGADVKMLSCEIDDKGYLKNRDSGETSLAQKFGDDNFGDGNSLDELFKNREYDFIWLKWKEILINKYRQVESEHNIKDIYYFLILRAGTKFHLCGLKLDLSKLSDTEININRSTNNSIWIKNFIKDELGHVKIYKAKKRLELRLKPKKWVENNLVITFDTSFNQINANIREKIESETLEEYIDRVLIPIIKSN